MKITRTLGGTVQARHILVLLSVAACAFLPARGNSEPLLNDARALEEKEGQIPTPTNRQECYEDCEYKYGKDTEKCNRKPKKERPACHSAALEKRTKCRNDCDKKYPE